MTRRKNPVHGGSGKKFRYRTIDGIKVPPKGAKLNKRERREFSKTVDYIDRVKLMRPYFGDAFKPDAGFNLSDVESWTPQQKAKVTRYFRIMAPRITGGEKVVKRYRRPDHLKAAIEATLQEEHLPGQTAAVFSIDPGQTLEVKFPRKGKRPVVTRGGVLEQEFRFDKNALLRNWKGEVTRLLNQTDARLFKVIMGANRSEKTFNREQLMDEIISLMESYPVRIKGRKFDDRRFDDWLNGFVAYQGTTKRKLQQDTKRHKAEVEERRMLREQERARRIREFNFAVYGRATAPKTNKKRRRKKRR